MRNCETATLRNSERAKLRKGDAKERDFMEILIFETAKQRKGEMALSGHHTNPPSLTHHQNIHG